MPTNTRRNRTKVPTKFQIRIIKAIALEGHLSNKKITERLNAQHSDVSVAIKSLCETGFVVLSYAHIQERRAHEKYYALTKKGFQEFIDGSPSSTDFCTAILRSHSVRTRSGVLSPMDNKEFEEHYILFEQRFLGYASTHGYLVQSPFFNKLYEQWLAEYHPSLFEQNQLKNIIRLVHSSFFERLYDESLKKYDINGITIAQKVLECLAIHRSITEKQINEFLNSKQKLIEKKLAGKAFKYPEFLQHDLEFDYAITPVNIRRVIDSYTLPENHIRDELRKFGGINYDNTIKSYLEFLFHLIVLKKDGVDGPRYELSLFGIILIFAIITHPHQKMFYVNNELKKNNEDLIKFYSMASQNYADKLPLIFGKWSLLTKTWHYAYKWFLPVLYQNIEDEFARAIRPGSVSITLGGVKEYQDTMQEIAFHTTARLFELYRGLKLVLRHADQIYDSEIPLIRAGDHQAGLSALKKKQNELAALLKYADIGKFVDKLKDNLTQVDRHLELVYSSELAIIEKALASEITFLFYINLARNKFLDYTDEGRYFLGDERDTGYKDATDFHILRPSDFLRIILKSDKELKNIFLEWMANIRDYRQRSAEQMEEFEKTIRKWKNRQRVS